MRTLRRRLAWLLRRAEFEHELDEEIRYHRSLMNGALHFGNEVLIKEDSHSMCTFTFWEQLAKDARYGFRAMANNKLFTLMAVLSLALGIGANTAFYSVMDAIMIRALPVRNPAELVIFNWNAKSEPEVIHSHSGNSYSDASSAYISPDFPWPAYELLRDHNTVFSTMFAFRSEGRLNLVMNGQAELGAVELVSGNYFNGLGVPTAAGRLITADDDRAGSDQVAVLSYPYWRGRFGGDSAVIGQTIQINGFPFTVIGVSAPEFYGVQAGDAPVIYVPMANRPSLARNYGNEHDTMFIDSHFYWENIMGRLRPGITLPGAQAEIAARFHQFVLSSAENDKQRANLPALWLEEGGSGVDSLRRQYSKPIFIMMTMVALILVIACANIANLLLARSTARRREMAVRLSLGAGRLRVMRQLFTESLLLSIPGALLGLAVAAAGVKFLVWLMANGRAGFVLHAEIDWRVLAFTLAVAVTTGLLFGLAPAIEATRLNITPALKEARSTQARSRPFGLSRILVVSQIGLSLLLVLGAGLFVHTLANLHSIQLGFNKENILLFSLDASKGGYKGAALRDFYAGLDERFRSLPGVRAATFTSNPLVSGSSSGGTITIPGVGKDANGKFPNTSYVAVGPTFFETMQIPILLGRALNARDVEGAPLVGVVNEVFVKKYFGGRNPIGQHFRFGPEKNKTAPDIVIVGIAKTARYNSLKNDIPPVTYFAARQNQIQGPPRDMYFELRTVGDPLAMSTTVQRVVHDIVPGVPISEITTQAAKIDATISQERTFADLCSVFAALALIIASVGLYGTMTYAVSRRTNEIGIRVALGAQRRRITWMVLREVLVLTTTGVVVGLAGAWFSASAIKSFLFGMKPEDPLSIGIAVIVLAAAALAAGYAPAWRASRLDPMRALRHE